MADVWRFLMAVMSHWLVLVGGATVIVILGVIERLSGRALSVSLYAGLLLVLFLAACFLAWRDEHEKALAQQRGLVLAIDRTIIGETDQSSTTVLVRASVINSGGPASALTNWRVSVKPAGSAAFIPFNRVEVPLEQKLTFHVAPGVAQAPVVLRGGDLLNMRPGERVEPGGILVGYLFSASRDVRREQLGDGTVVKVTCVDAFGNALEASHTLSAVGREQIKRFQ